MNMHALYVQTGAGTEGVVKAALAGSGGQRAEFLLNPTLCDLDKRYFRRGATDHFLLMTRGTVYFLALHSLTTGVVLRI